MKWRRGPWKGNGGAIFSRFLRNILGGGRYDDGSLAEELYRIGIAADQVDWETLDCVQKVGTLANPSNKNASVELLNYGAGWARNPEAGKITAWLPMFPSEMPVNPYSLK